MSGIFGPKTSKPSTPSAGKGGYSPPVKKPAAVPIKK
jgi:hypothetical protein